MSIKPRQFVSFLFTLLICLFICEGLFCQSHAFHDNEVNQFNRDSIYTSDSLQFLQHWDEYWEFGNLGNYDSAIIACHRMIEFGKELMSVRYDSTLFEKYGKAYGNIGFMLLKLGRYDEGLAYSLQSYDTLRSRFGENHIRISEVFVGICGYYEIKGDYDHAIEYIYKSLHVMNNCLPKDHPYFGNSYNNIGSVYYAKKDYKNAIVFYKKATEHARNSSKLPYRLISLANVYLLDGQTDMAKETIDELFKANQEFENLPIINAYGNYRLGQFYTKESEFETAVYYFRELLSEIERNINDPKYLQLKTNVHFELGKTYKQKEDYSLALNEFNSAIEELNQYYGTGHTRVLDVLHQKAEIYSKINEFEKALSIYQEILIKTVPLYSTNDYHINPTIENLPSNLTVLEALFAKSKALKESYQYNLDIKKNELALSTYKLAFDLNDKMRLNYFWENSKTNLSESIINELEEAVIVALNLYDLTKENIYLEEAYQFVNKSKAVILAESIKDDHAKAFTGIPIEKLEEEKQLKEEILFYENLIYEENIKEDQDSVKLYYWHNKLFEEKTNYDVFISQLEEKFPSYYDQKYKDISVSISDIQNSIDSKTVLIEYFTGASKLFAFGISKDSVITYQQEIDTALLNHVKEYKSLFFEYSPNIRNTNNYDYLSFINLSNSLYQTLVEPLLNAIKVENIVFIPDGILNYLPFETLLLSRPESNELSMSNYRNLHYLLKDYNVRTEYSSTLFIHPQKSATNNYSYLGFAPEYKGDKLLSSRSNDTTLILELYPDLSRSSLSALKYNIPEVQNAAQYLEGDSYLGVEALESNFKKFAKNKRILHLAMHAFTNDVNPMYSQLVFSQEKDSLEDGILYAYELYNMRLNANLAVLSACDTGAGKLQKGEGVMSLSRAFKHAGCPNIVMSLWKANDKSTFEIVDRFYSNLTDNYSKSKALREAKLHYLENSKEESHPYYWATLVLIGDDHPIDFATGIFPFWAKSLLMLAGLIGIVFLFKKFK